MESRRKAFFGLFLALFLASGLKLWLIWLDAIPFNADEAVVALMARHILRGERPVFFYGQAYMGSLDAFLVALGFRLFGEHVWVIRLVQLWLYLGTIITTLAILRSGFGSNRAGILAAGLLAVPTVNMTLYTTASLGGYGEALLLGNLILYSGLVLSDRLSGAANGQAGGWNWGSLWLGLVVGVLMGMGLWANGLTLVYSAPTVVLLLWASWGYGRRIGWKGATAVWAAILAGFLIGSSPWWIYAAQKGWQALISELLGSAVAVEKSSWLARMLMHLFNLVVLGGTVLFGLRPPWEVRWLAMPLLPLALMFWLATLVFFIRMTFQGSQPRRKVYLLLAGTVGVLVAGFILTPFGVDPSGRYFLPLGVVFSMVAAEMVTVWIKSERWQFLIVAGVMAFNLWGTGEAALRNPPGLTTQFDPAVVIDHRYDDELLAFLEAHGELRGYTNYWVAYPLAFLSQERIIYTPRLPYHPDLRYTSRDDRYLPYSEWVDQSDRVAYITSHTPRLDELLRKKLKERGIAWREAKIGDYQLFYQLSAALRPDEIDYQE